METYGTLKIVLFVVLFDLKDGQNNREKGVTLYRRDFLTRQQAIKEKEWFLQANPNIPKNNLVIQWQPESENIKSE